MRGKRFLAGIVSAVMILSGFSFSAATAKAADKYFPEDETKIEYPGVASRKVCLFDPSFFSVTGFAKGSVDLDHRIQYINTDAYRTVKDERAFLEALEDARNGKVKVIEIAADLDLGWNVLSEEAKNASSMIKSYGWNTQIEVVNPSILESGVSQLELADIHGLTIFSQAGNTVKHVEWKLQGSSSDIIIRNLMFDEMWTMNNVDDGDNHALGWSLLKLNGVKGVWIDHCSFSIAYDGNMDSENGSSDMTSSWCNYCLPADPDPDHNSMLYKTFTYMEERYQRGLEKGTVYAKLREEANGDVGKIMAYEAYHKGFNMNGSGEGDFKDGEDKEDGNQRLHLTMAYNKVSNIIQRFPLVRQGTVNILNCYLDNSGHEAAAAALGRTVDSVACSVRAGGTAGFDTCVFRDVDCIVDGNERNIRDNNNKEWGDVFVNARNHTLVVNSKIIGKGENGGDYVGSSWDNDGDNPFIGHVDQYWNDNKSTLGSFQWFSHIVNEEQYTRRKLPDAPFQFTYDSNLPYNYQVLPLEEVVPTVEKYAGAYVLNEEPAFWLSTEYASDSAILTAAEKYGDVPAEDLDLNLPENNTIEMFVGNMKQITADVIPSHATEKTITWVSSDPEVVEVKDSGLLIAKKAGKAAVTASIRGEAGKTIEKPPFTVEVLIPVESITIEGAPKNLYLGDESTPPEQVQLKAVVLPENATNKAVIWSSSNSGALKVDANGMMTPLKAGSNIRITCTSVSNPSVTKTVRISVKTGKNPEPSQVPSEQPSEAPSQAPSEQPSEAPSQAPSEQPSEAPSQAPVMLGDPGGDGSITADDALSILKYVVKLTDYTSLQIQAADVNEDGNVTAEDALLVLKKIVGLIEDFSVDSE